MIGSGKKDLEMDFRADVVTHIVGDRLECLLWPGAGGGKRNSHGQEERPES
jgi:hypothetical protein